MDNSAQTQPVLPTPPPAPPPVEPPPAPASIEPAPISYEQTLPLPQPSKPTQTPSGPKKSFSFSLPIKIILGVVILLLIVGVGAFFYLQPPPTEDKSATETAPGCHYQEVTCVKSPCPKILICQPTIPPEVPTVIPTVIPATPLPSPSVKSYSNSLNGYSLIYPSDFTVSSDSANLFELKNTSLTMTFVSEAATDSSKAAILKRPKFCPASVVDTDTTVSGKLAYRRDGTFTDGSSCLEVVISYVPKLLDIKGMPIATSSAGVTLFNQILQTIKFN